MNTVNVIHTLVCNDRDSLTRLADHVELYPSRFQREERIVPAAADIVAGMELGSPLTDDDFARIDQFAAKPFHSEPLCVAVAAVSGTTRTFFMCHNPKSPSKSLID
jgi:hypothetical protein